LASFIFSYYYYVLWSPYGRRTQRNADNVDKVAVGMSLNDAVTIMGKPDTVFSSYYNDGSTIYQYEPPFAASDGIDIYVDSTFTVRRIVFE
jgi:hypothetical protein